MLIPISVTTIDRVHADLDAQRSSLAATVERKLARQIAKARGQPVQAETGDGEGDLRITRIQVIARGDTGPCNRQQRH